MIDLLIFFINVLIQSSINLFGSTMMAANTAASNIEGFIFTSTNSMHQTTLSFTAQNYGAKKPKRITKTFIYCLVIVTTIGVVMEVGAYLLGDLLLGIYSPNPIVVELGLKCLSIVGICYAFCKIMDFCAAASRGIDVEKVDLIVNYDVPAQSEAYIHRIGRSARKNETGCAITLVDSNEKWRLDKLNEYLSEPLEMKDAQVISTYEIDEKSLKALGKPLAFKQKKGKDVHADTMKIYINAGKSKKVRAGDIVGAICEIEGVSGDDIGVIAIQEHQSFVDILNGKGKLVLQHLKRIKKKNVKVQKAK